MATATYPPRKVNNVANSVFNPSDYAVSGNDLKYVKLSGSSMTGSLSCIGLTCSTGGLTSTNSSGTNTLAGTIQMNSNITLPTVYNASPNPAVPTISQLGGNNKLSATAAVYVSNTISNIKTLTLNPGIYILIYRVVLTNTSAAALTVSAFSASISLTQNNLLDEDYRFSNYATQTLAATTGQTSLNGSFFYSLSTAATNTLYLNYIATASAAVNVAGFIQAVRIG
jgi:hypothetical protein